MGWGQRLRVKDSSVKCRDDLLVVCRRQHRRSRNAVKGAKIKCGDDVARACPYELAAGTPFNNSERRVGALAW